MAGRSARMFTEYPDIVDVTQMCAMLGGIGKKTAYRLLREGKVTYVKVGKSFKIPKYAVIEYIIDNQEKVLP